MWLCHAIWLYDSFIFPDFISPEQVLGWHPELCNRSTGLSGRNINASLEPDFGWGSGFQYTEVEIHRQRGGGMCFAVLRIPGRSDFRSRELGFFYTFTNRVVSYFREKQLQHQETKPEVYCLKKEKPKHVLVTRGGFTHNYLYKNYLKNIEN